MAFINWDNNYSVNIKEIDEQHKSWIGLINNLHEAMKVGKGKDVLDETLNQVVNYTYYHFGSEEKFFAKHGYPETPAHKKEHDEFIEEMKKLKEDYDNGKSILSIEIMGRMKSWLTDHIMVVDKKYSSFLNGKGVS